MSPRKWFLLWSRIKMVLYNWFKNKWWISYWLEANRICWEWFLFVCSPSLIVIYLHLFFNALSSSKHHHLNFRFSIDNWDLHEFSWKRVLFEFYRHRGNIYFLYGSCKYMYLCYFEKKLSYDVLLFIMINYMHIL